MNIKKGVNLVSSKLVTISMPPALYRQARRAAREEGRTQSELLREALRRYLFARSWQELQRYGKQRAKALGIRSERDVVRLVKEFRREQAKKTAKT